MIHRPATRRCDEVGRLFAAGQSIEQLASHYNVLPETVVQHLLHFHEAGGLEAERLLIASRLPESERAQVFSVFERLGCSRLAPVYEALSGAVPYKELHVLRLYWLCRERKR